MTATKSTTRPWYFAVRRASALARVAFSGSSLLVACALSVPAHAQSNSADSDRANLLFKKGKVAFNDGKFDDALRIYSEAWRLKQSPDIAANLAQTESELGKHRDAAEHFAFALAHLLPSSTDEQKKALADGLDVEKKEVGTLHVTLEPGDASLSLDDSPVILPPSGDIFVVPGEHRCSVTHEGYDASQQAVRGSSRWRPARRDSEWRGPSDDPAAGRQRSRERSLARARVRRRRHCGFGGCGGSGVSTVRQFASR
jgi:tetratricopeptide (TPR) repeat protein